MDAEKIIGQDGIQQGENRHQLTCPGNQEEPHGAKVAGLIKEHVLYFILAVFMGNLSL